MVGAFFLSSYIFFFVYINFLMFWMYHLLFALQRSNIFFIDLNVRMVRLSLWWKHKPTKIAITSYRSFIFSLFSQGLCHYTNLAIFELHLKLEDHFWIAIINFDMCSLQNFSPCNGAYLSCTAVWGLSKWSSSSILQNILLTYFVLPLCSTKMFKMKQILGC